VGKLTAPAARSKSVTLKPPRRSPTTKPKCVVCGAELRSGHCLGDLVCDAHPRDGYNPRQDPLLDEHILVLLYRAQGRPLNLYRALGCDPFDTNASAVRDSVRRLNASGIVCARGAGAAGRRLCPIRGAGGGRVGA